ncbi:MAG: glycosyltransferase family 9 protein [Rickettsiales bacterium]|nr:glycosyltransferase family 9 protein [Rickettsiales bacterium]
MSALDNILIIKHGALGDIVLASGPIAAIRKNNPIAHITVLTSPAFASLFQMCPHVDEVLVDVRPKPWQIGKCIKLYNMLRRRAYVFVYDLQTSSRSSLYLRFLRGKPEFSGIAKKASFRHNTPERKTLHTIERQKQQLKMTGITRVPSPSIGWLKDDIADIKPDVPYVMIVPGGSAHRPKKRWPLEYYSHLTKWIVEQGHIPVLIGTKAEEKLLNHIAARVPKAVNLCDKTSFGQVASLGRKAEYAIGNDTGPMHIIAAVRCNSVVLFSAESNPDLCAPRGKHVTVLQENDLTKLLPDDVQTHVKLVQRA